MILAGCADSSPTEPPAEAGDGEPVDAVYAIPDTLRETGLLPVGYQWDCVSGACPQYPFELFGDTDVDLTLNWNIPLNDIDVFVYTEDGGIVMEGTDVVPQTSEHQEAVLPAGNYTISVEPYEAATDEFTLVVDFALPR